MEAKRDIEFDEYKDTFMAHIMGDVENDRIPHESADEDEVPATNRNA